MSILPYEIFKMLHLFFHDSPAALQMCYKYDINCFKVTGWGVKDGVGTVGKVGVETNSFTPSHTLTQALPAEFPRSWTKNCLTAPSMPKVAVLPAEDVNKR